MDFSRDSPLSVEIYFGFLKFFDAIYLSYKLPKQMYCPIDWTVYKFEFNDLQNYIFFNQNVRINDKLNLVNILVVSF